MKKMIRNIMAGCLLCSAFAVGGTVIAFASQGEDASAKNNGVAPEISVEWGDYSKTDIPQAIKNEQYKIFKASAEDFNGNDVPVTTRVYLHYLEPTKAIINLKNGSVTPNHYGVYTVEYKATDSLGNESTVCYDFVCEERETISVVLSEAETSALAGSETPIATYDVSNAVGKVSTTITATLQEDKRIVYDLTGCDTFAPAYAGEYVIEYACSDYNLTAKEDYTLTVSAHETPVFFEELSLPRYFVVGKEYTLPTANVYQFAHGKPASITPVITVKQGNDRTQTLGVDRKFVARKEGELTLTYSATYGENVQTRTYTVRAVEIGTGATFDVAKYFYTQNAVVSAKSTLITVATEMDGATVEFINALPSRGFEYKFSIPNSGNNFGTLDMYLTDSENAEVALKFTYENVNGKEGVFSVNDGKKYSTTGFSDAAIRRFTYDEETGNVTFGSDVSLTLPSTFTGFPSGKMYFSFVFRGVTGSAQMYVNAINNQVLYKGSNIFAPMVWFNTYKNGACTVGDTIALEPVYVGDVLDADFTVKYSVIGPDKKYVVDENGLLLSPENTVCTSEYRFIARSLGKYRVDIKVRDESGNEASFNYAVTVEDLEEPAIAFVDEMPKELKKGESFTVSDLEIFDNFSETCDVFVLLILPNGVSKEVQVGDTYALESAGSYVIYYMVTDEAGNITTAYHVISVA